MLAGKGFRQPQLILHIGALPERRQTIFLGTPNIMPGLVQPLISGQKSLFLLYIHSRTTQALFVLKSSTNELLATHFPSFLRAWKIQGQKSKEKRKKKGVKKLRGRKSIRVEEEIR